MTTPQHGEISSRDRHETRMKEQRNLTRHFFFKFHGSGGDHNIVGRNRSSQSLSSGPIPKRHSEGRAPLARNASPSLLRLPGKAMLFQSRRMVVGAGLDSCVVCRLHIAEFRIRRTKTMESAHALPTGDTVSCHVDHRDTL